MKFIGQNADEARQVFRLLNKQIYGDEQIISYSGRGMNGKYCLAIVIQSSMIADLFFAMGKFVGEHDIDLPHITHVSTDNMANDKVVYWKAYEALADDAEDEAEACQNAQEALLAQSGYVIEGEQE